MPCAAGSCIVYRPSAAAPGFVEVGTGGRFKGRDANVPITTLAAAWVPETQMVYIGKGDDLRQRLRTYARFGAREPVGTGAGATSGSSGMPPSCWSLGASWTTSARRATTSAVCGAVWP